MRINFQSVKHKAPRDENGKGLARTATGVRGAEGAWTAGSRFPRMDIAFEQSYSCTDPSILSKGGTRQQYISVGFSSMTQGLLTQGRTET